MVRLSFTLGMLLIPHALCCMGSERSEQISFYNGTGKAITVTVAATMLMPDGTFSETITTEPISMAHQHFRSINRPLSKAYSGSSTVCISANNEAINYIEDKTTLASKNATTYYGIALSKALSPLHHRHSKIQ